MRLPKGTSYKLLSTKSTPFDNLSKDLGSEGFSGYLRITVEAEGDIEDGYLLLKEGEVIGAEYQGKEHLFSKKAFEKIKGVWALEGIIDIFKFSEFQMQISIEENEDSFLSKPAKPRAAKAEKTKETAVAKEEKIEKPKPTAAQKDVEKPKASVEKPSVKPEVIEEPAKEEPEILEDSERLVAEDIIKKRKERLEMLKKFGLKEPEDDYVDSVLNSFNLPSDKELNKKARELKKEILKKLKQTASLDELDLFINPAKMHNTVEFNIEVYVKPYNKDIEEEVKSTIESTLKEKLEFPYGKGLTINAA